MLRTDAQGDREDDGNVVVQGVPIEEDADGGNPPEEPRPYVCICGADELNAQGSNPFFSFTLPF